MTEHSAMQSGLEKLTLGANNVELNRRYELPPEAMWYKAVPSKTRGTNDLPLPLLVLVNGNHPPEWYANQRFQQRPKGTYFVKVVAYGDPSDGGHYEVRLW